METEGAPPRARMPWRVTLPYAAALVLGFGVLWSLRDLARPLGFLVIAIAVAEAFAPAVTALERGRVSRGLAIVLVYLGVVGVVAGVGWLLVPTILAQALELGRRAPEFAAVAQRLIHQGHATVGVELDAVLGRAINSALIGLAVGVGLALAGVRYPVILGTVTMLLEPFPVIGPWIAAAPVALVGLLDSPQKALVALGVYVVLTQLGGQALTPAIMRRSTDIPQTLVIFAILAGAAAGGLLGLVVSIPLVAALRVFVLRVVVPVVRRWTGAEAGAA